MKWLIPMSPDQARKNDMEYSFINHKKIVFLFRVSDNREFWQRAEERNANTARLYGQLGLTQYAAMEAFVRWRG
ncbi:MAG: hypothetical protein WKF59_01135 [Chitinophagaceae bacterium]